MPSTCITAAYFYYCCRCLRQCVFFLPFYIHSSLYNMVSSCFWAAAYMAKATKLPMVTGCSPNVTIYHFSDNLESITLHTSQRPDCSLCPHLAIAFALESRYLCHRYIWYSYISFRKSLQLVNIICVAVCCCFFVCNANADSNCEHVQSKLSLAIFPEIISHWRNSVLSECWNLSVRVPLQLTHTHCSQ